MSLQARVPPNRRALLSVALLALLAAVLLAACTEDGEQDGRGLTSPPPELEDGVLRIGSDIPYPPFESFAGEPSTLTGIDVDLAQALGEELGVEVEFVDVDVDGRIPALEEGRVDVIMSAMTVTEERRQLIDFIPYFKGGTGILVPAGNPTGIRVDTHLCLHTVAVQQGTLQLDQLRALNTDLCAGAVNIRIKTFAQQDQAVAELRAGGADAVVVDYAVALNDVLLSDGGLEVIDFQILPVTYGIGVRKDSGELKEALTDALATLMTDSRYDNILYRWGARAGIWKEVAS
ncbi:MAG: ABC transporter substrate-binding protein [Dehalococcoidia bacterium]|nr:ABC transporter substrate-binding protein [Dehalococcoidia bacterium]